MKPLLSSFLSQASKLGDQMADLHLHNQKLRDKSKEEKNTVGTFTASVHPSPAVSVWVGAPGGVFTAG